MSELPSLPKLRPGVSLVPFASSAKGETYLVTLPDGRSLQATRTLHDLLTRLDGSHRLEEIAWILSGVWKRPVRPEEVRDWIDRYVLPNDLLVPASTQPQAAASEPSKTPPARGVQLIRGELALPLTQPLRILFRPPVSLPLLWASAICHGLFYSTLPVGTAPGFLTLLPPSLYLISCLLLLGSVLFHEFGHLAACRYFGCPHGEIRIGLYLIFPVFYANVSAAWRLRQKARIVVDLAGVYFQLLLTIPVFLLFHLTRDRVWMFLFLELDAMMLFCLNPFLRFDGYWLCSDFLGVPNLRSRSRLLMKRLVGRLAGRSPPPLAPLLEIRPAARFGAGLYGIGTYLFAGLVLAFLWRAVAPRVTTMPSQVQALLAEGFTDGCHGNTAGMLARLVQLLFLCVTVLAAGRMSFRGIRTAGRLCRYGVSRLRRGSPKSAAQG